MAHTVLVLSPPSSFPEAFLDFCRQKIRVNEPILLYSHLNLEVYAKQMSEKLESSGLIYTSKPTQFLQNIPEIAQRQAQNCIFLLANEQMTEFCRDRGVDEGTLVVKISPEPGWTVTRSEFQGFLQAKMGESWRGESVPQLNLQMHLSFMKEKILESLKTEGNEGSGDWNSVMQRLERKISEEIQTAALKIEENHRMTLEKMLEMATKRVSEAHIQLETGRKRLETQAKTLLEEQNVLSGLLTQVNSALQEAKLLKDKVSSYEESNRVVQGLVRQLSQGKEMLGPGRQERVREASQVKPSQLTGESGSIPPPIPSKPSAPAATGPKPPPFPGTNIAPVQPSAPVGLKPSPMLGLNLQSGKSEMPQVSDPKPPPPSQGSNFSGLPPFNPAAVQPSSKTVGFPRSPVPIKPTSLSSDSVTITNILESAPGADTLTVTVHNNTTYVIEGAELVMVGTPPRPVREQIPVLPPGRTEFLISMDCLPEAPSVDFFLRKDNQPVSKPFGIELGLDEVNDQSKPSSLATSQVSYPKQHTDLTPQQMERYRAAVQLLGSRVNPEAQEKIKKLVQDPSNSMKTLEELLDLFYRN